MNRNNCCICDEKLTKIIYSMKSYPVGIVCNNEDINTDIRTDMDFALCTCGVIQLKTLIDPTILYSSSHNNTFNTPTWAEHHNQFAIFIKKSINTNHIIEFGGSSGHLSLLLKDLFNSYTIVDLCNKDPQIKGVKFIQGNCESWNVPINSTIIMSHIFEHLYNPRKFLNNIQDKVNDIFISIPNMDYSLTNHVITFLSNEHTFFINNSIILSLFAEFGYKCKTSFEFKIHSIFYHFTKSEKKSISYFPRTNELINYFQSIENRFTTISIAQNTFIVPGSYYGQIVYYFLKNKNNILGFLDNDITKQNKRLHGTPLFTYSMEKIKEYKTPSILLIKSPYEEEIKKQLLEYNPNTNVIVL